MNELRELVEKFSKDAYLAGAKSIVVMADDGYFVHSSMYGHANTLLFQGIQKTATATPLSLEQSEELGRRFYGERPEETAAPATAAVRKAVAKRKAE